VHERVLNTSTSTTTTATTTTTNNNIIIIIIITSLLLLLLIFVPSIYSIAKPRRVELVSRFPDKVIPGN